MDEISAAAVSMACEGKLKTTRRDIAHVILLYRRLGLDIVVSVLIRLFGRQSGYRLWKLGLGRDI